MRVLPVAVVALSVLMVVPGAEAHIIKKECDNDAPWVDTNPLDNGLLTSDPSAVLVYGGGDTADCRFGCFVCRAISIVWGCGSHTKASN
ncbi:MAG: hypothetical protein ACT4PT_13395 [Methanobacteriota archaeon]